MGRFEAIAWVVSSLVIGFPLLCWGGGMLIANCNPEPLFELLEKPFKKKQ
jgi:hypothetical protein